MLVVGAGAIGAFAALHLARAGYDVTVLERNVPGVEASGPMLARLAPRTSRFAWRAIFGGGHRGLARVRNRHRTRRRVITARAVSASPKTRTGVERLREIAAAQSAAGLPIEHIERRRSAPPRAVPLFGGARGQLLPARWPQQRLDRLASAGRARRAAGGCPHPQRRHGSAHRGGGRRLVRRSHRSRRRRRADRLILSAGVWSRDFLVAARIELPVVLRINQMMVTEPAPPILEHVIFHVDGHLTLKQVHPAMSCLVGGGWPGGGDFRSERKETLLASTLGNAAVALRVVPALAPLACPALLVRIRLAHRRSNAGDRRGSGSSWDVRLHELLWRLHPQPAAGTWARAGGNDWLAAGRVGSILAD